MRQHGLSPGLSRYTLGQISIALSPDLIASRSPSVFRCLGVGTSEASTICPDIGM